MKARFYLNLYGSSLQKALQNHQDSTLSKYDWNIVEKDFPDRPSIIHGVNCRALSSCFMKVFAVRANSAL